MNHTPSLILVIDDDPGMCRVARALFEGEGYQVVTLQDAASALSRLTAEGALRPDLILLDLHMPGMGGATFAREYRARAAAPAPIVLVSADITPPTEALAGAVDHIPKPFDVDRLLTTVRRRIASR